MNHGASSLGLETRTPQPEPFRESRLAAFTGSQRRSLQGVHAECPKGSGRSEYDYSSFISFSPAHVGAMLALAKTQGAAGTLVGDVGGSFRGRQGFRVGRLPRALGFGDTSSVVWGLCPFVGGFVVVHLKWPS